MSPFTKFFLIFPFLSLHLFGHICQLEEASFDTFEYVNHWREQSGLNRLKNSKVLSEAALNHSRYRSRYHTGHKEYPKHQGFTGKTPSERAVFAGYPLRSASENIAEAPSAIVAVENLMAAIYHRFGFLNYSIDEMGMGEAKIKAKDNTVFTYVMGNSILASECKESSYRNETPFYYKICKNINQRISVVKKKSLDSLLLKSRPDFVLYPFNGAKGVLPVFYEEHPDPLPYHSMVGNPISIEFHPRFDKRSIQIKGVHLSDVKHSQELELIPFYQRNDPHKKLKSTQFAFFPKNRLDWGREYEARLTYKISGEALAHEVVWRFTTKQMPALIEVNKKINRVYIEKNKTYTFYFKPTEKAASDKNSLYPRFSYSYYKGSQIKHEIMDSMTVKVCLHGKKGNIFKIKNLSRAMTREVEIVLK